MAGIKAFLRALDFSSCLETGRAQARRTETLTEGHKGTVSC